MAATEAGRQLTQAHRLLQVRNALALARIADELWRSMMSRERPMETAGTWLASVMPLVLEYRMQSRDFATAYYEQFREVEASDPTPTFTPEPDDLEEVSAALRTSMMVTGPLLLVERLQSAAAPDDVFEQTGTEAAAAAVRHAANGGRRYLHRAVRADAAAYGWMRVTADDPCFFCAMLASRGPVYKDDSFDASDPRFVDHPSRPSDVKVHDSCMCSLEPVMSRDSAPYELHQEFERLWRESTKGKSGHQMVLAFRRAYAEWRAATR